MNRRHWKLWLLTSLLIVAYAAWVLLRPLPELKPQANTSLQYSTGTASLSWPAQQSAVGVAGSSILETHGPQTPLPTASTAKLITALVVLKQKPLALNQQGPVITLTAADKAIYDAYAAKGGSTVPVAVGEQITEYQMLEALLLPSANNMADSLANWAYGSLPNYAAAANAWLKQQGLGGTTVGKDASGFDPSTTSTARDLVRLGGLAMQNPVLAQVVSKPVAADIPLAPNAKNVNFLLGTSGIVGIKTGNTDQAGGVYVAASKVIVNRKPITIVTAVIGAPTLFASMKYSLPLIQSAQANFKAVTVVHKGDVVAHYQTKWGNSLPVKADHDLTLTTWRGQTVTTHLQLPSIRHDTYAGQTVSQLKVTDSITSATESVNLSLGQTAPQPTLVWRLTHPL